MTARGTIVIGMIFFSAACVARSAEDSNRSRSRAVAASDDADGRCIDVVDIRNTFGGTPLFPRDFNDRGEIAGGAWTGDAYPQIVHAFVWDGATLIDLGTLGGESSEAMALNDDGDATGTSDLPGNSAIHAFWWSGGKLHDLGDLGGGWSRGVAINNHAQIAGSSATASGDDRAVLWENGVIKDLGTLGGRFSRALAINERGQVMGHSLVADGSDHVFLWDNGVMKDLGAGVPGPLNDAGDVLIEDYPNLYLWHDGTRTQIIPYGDAVAASGRDINNRAQVVGGARRPDGRDLSFLWHNGATATIGGVDLPGNTAALALNESAQVVGIVGPGDNPQAFSWQDGKLTLLPSAEGRTIALAVNERGQIMGTWNDGTLVKVWTMRPCGGGGGAADGGPPADRDGGSNGDAGGGGGGGGGKMW
jgi:probable HAF family extracellular repeat protein